MFPDSDSFSPRELEIIRLISSGLPNKEIGRRLFISPETVKWYTRQIYPKLGVSNRTQAAQHARDLGLLDDLSDEPNAGRQKPLRSNLPAPLTSFIGRRKALSDLDAAMQRARLVTITGPGGIGKSRLALEFARQVSLRFKDGTWFVELAHLSDPEEVLAEVAEILNVSSRGDDAHVSMLQRYLMDKQLLLVLDNFEHLLAAAPAVASLLESAPEVAVLVTSRESLRLNGEHIYRLEPLSIDHPVPDSAAGSLHLSDAAALFLERAANQAVDLPTEEEAAEICRILDGLPLAIELAVPLLRILAPARLIERLQTDLSDLPPGPRNLPERQRTLGAAFEWSYQLLEAEEKGLLKVLSVFKDGATLDALSQVSGHHENRVIDWIYALVNSNLVVPREALDGEIYFTMLQTTTVFAGEKCKQDRKCAAYQQAHIRYYLDLASAAHRGFIGERHRYWFNRIQREHGNYRIAIRRALSAGDILTVLIIPYELRGYWRDVGFHREGYQWIQEALHSGGNIPDDVYGAALITAADYGIDLQFIDQAEEYIQLALQTVERSPNSEKLAWCRGILAVIRLIQNNLVQSRTLAEECLSGFLEIGDVHGIAFTWNLFGEIARTEGDYPTAIGYYNRSLAIAQKHGMIIRSLAPTSNLGAVLNRQGDFQASEKLHRETIRICLELGTLFGVSYEIGMLAGPILSLGKVEQAVRLLAASNAQLEAFDWAHQHIDQIEFLHIYHQAKELLDDEAFQQAWEEGRHMTVQEVAEYALSKDD